MQTTIDINDDLLQKAMDISQLTDKKQVIELALKSYVSSGLNYQRLLDLRGKVEFWDDEESQTTQR
ncbi:type II toxin-antitoxin system VapB family antitoxin [Spirosoma sp. KUDC1026]|uniref:type II toxin-antitoxin system VapB family antitoxin n=1 Tax=Spirosoma sp. KUDC1026 TaxID=2745947 RepID=UPI00159BC319|nr:type II toxin-antitoxin system VapB family antitoxin [Spirosoma sp. KUDC1026]QKZ12493.1 type II toxin-antitoxin system VapB family antitoxin [Spirosoma sp. KUDC1026]